jgi:chromosome segregation ATPase
MARIDFIALQQRLAQQQPKSATTVPAERSKAPPTTAATATLTGTLRATTTMRAALPLKATNAREERARANVLRAQIDELNAALAAAGTEAARLNERVEALSADVERAEQRVAGAEARAARAEAAFAGERSRADVLRVRVNSLQHALLASQAVASQMMAEREQTTDVHARELAIARHYALTAQQAAAELRAAESARKARRLLTRLRTAWRGE